MSKNQMDERIRQMAASILYDFPIPWSIYQPDGVLIEGSGLNETRSSVSRTGVIDTFNLLSNSSTQSDNIAEFFKRALQGEVVTTPSLLHDTRTLTPDDSLPARPIWLQMTLFPIYDEQGRVSFVGLIQRDVTAQVEQNRAMEVARQEIAAQQDTIQSLSSPIIQVWDGILTVPMVGAIDAYRMTAITENMLEAIVRFQADIVIFDMTGVPMVDTQIASYLMSAARACSLLGSEVVLVGMSSAIAQTVVHLGVELSTLVTRANLQAGIAWAFDRLGLAVGRKEQMERAR